jgi:AraC family transcriptional regulator of adaptative response/methylated-DNA-[protein]-cysteine methyltransferase
MHMKGNHSLNFVSQNSWNEMWSAVIAKERSADGRFFFAVSSTGIYCKPSCPSRRPAPERVRFFTTPDEAEAEGFRACRRCKPRESGAKDPQIEMVERTCRLIESEPDAQFSLEVLAQKIGCSPYHLQRTFKKVIGVSPRQYAEAKRMEQFKASIRKGSDVTTAIYDAGFGSSSRLYEKSDSQLGMKPGDYGRGGAGQQILFAVADCPIGKLLVATTERGICSITLGDSAVELEAKLRQEFPSAEISNDALALDSAIGTVIEHLSGKLPRIELRLDLRATAFQRRVWEELQKIPLGETRSYTEIARAIDRPKAVRAVARACATNPVALAIPCHRVIREGGELGGYRWGLERKKRLLRSESETAKASEE